MMLFSFMGGVSFGGRLRARGSGCGHPKATPPSLRLHTFRAYLLSPGNSFTGLPGDVLPAWAGDLWGDPGGVVGARRGPIVRAVVAPCDHMVRARRLVHLA